MPSNTTVAVRKPKKGSKAEAILTLATTTNAHPPTIAAAVNTSRQMVHQVLDRYGIDAKSLQSYMDNRADILAGKQAQLIAAIDEDAIKTMAPRDRVTAAAILYDKERIERTGHGDTSRPLVVVVKGDNAQVQVNSLPRQGIEQNSQVIDIIEDDR